MYIIGHGLGRAHAEIPQGYGRQGQEGNTRRGGAGRGVDIVPVLEYRRTCTIDSWRSQEVPKILGDRHVRLYPVVTDGTRHYR
eukprot:653475-Amorphochlora_amoeboformis.AAC.1